MSRCLREIVARPEPEPMGQQVKNALLRVWHAGFDRAKPGEKDPLDRLNFKVLKNIPDKKTLLYIGLNNIIRDRHTNAARQKFLDGLKEDEEVSEGIWGGVGVKANAIKKNVVRTYFPDKLRVGIAALGATGKAIGYAQDGDADKAKNMRQWRNDIVSGKRQLRGTGAGKDLRDIVPLKEGWKRAIGMSLAAAGAGALTGASSVGGTPIGAIPGAAIAFGGYALSGGLKKDFMYTKDKEESLPKKARNPLVKTQPAVAAETAIAEGLLNKISKFLHAKSRKQDIYDKSRQQLRTVDKKYSDTYDTAIANRGRVSGFHDQRTVMQNARPTLQKLADRGTTLGKRMSAMHRGNFFSPNWPEKPRQLKYMGSK